MLASAMVAEAVAVEYLRGLSPDARAAAALRMRSWLIASMKEFSDLDLKLTDAKEIIGHRNLLDALQRGADPMLNKLLDLAGKDG